ncbi:hypothetical protein GCM10018965_076250 [Nonomuraea roseola]
MSVDATLVFRGAWPPIGESGEMISHHLDLPLVRSRVPPFGPPSFRLRKLQSIRRTLLHSSNMGAAKELVGLAIELEPHQGAMERPELVEIIDPESWSLPSHWYSIPARAACHKLGNCSDHGPRTTGSLVSAIAGLVASDRG